MYEEQKYLLCPEIPLHLYGLIQFYLYMYAQSMIHKVSSKSPHFRKDWMNFLIREEKNCIKFNGSIDLGKTFKAFPGSYEQIQFLKVAHSANNQLPKMGLYPPAHYCCIPDLMVMERLLCLNRSEAQNGRGRHILYTPR